MFTEWQIREVPTRTWTSEFEELFCGENASEVEHHVERCRPLLRAEFPRSRAKAFLWYLKDGALVTFYRRTGPFQIEVLRRYLHGSGEPAIQPWTGTYDDILAQLWRNWHWWSGSPPPERDEVQSLSDRQALADSLLTELDAIAQGTDGAFDSAKDLRAIREDQASRP